MYEYADRTSTTLGFVRLRPSYSCNEGTAQRISRATRPLFGVVASLSTLTNLEADVTARVVEHGDGIATRACDAANRLTEERSGYASTFTYDGAGNRLAAKQDGVITTYSNDLADQLTTSVVGTATTTYTYDNASNQTLQVVAPNTRTTYTWNDDNRQRALQLPSAAITTYTYRWDGLRVTKADASTTEKVVYDGQTYLLITDASDVLQVVNNNEPVPYGNLVLHANA